MLVLLYMVIVFLSVITLFFFFCNLKPAYLQLCCKAGHYTIHPAQREERVKIQVFPCCTSAWWKRGAIVTWSPEGNYQTISISIANVTDKKLQNSMLLTKLYNTSTPITDQQAIVWKAPSLVLSWNLYRKKDLAGSHLKYSFPSIHSAHSYWMTTVYQALRWLLGRNNLYPETDHNLANESEQIIIMKNSMGNKESSLVFTEKRMSQTYLELTK